MEQEAKYGAQPEERSKTAQTNPGTREPRPSRDQPEDPRSEHKST